MAGQKMDKDGWVMNGERPMIGEWMDSLMSDRWMDFVDGQIDRILEYKDKIWNSTQIPIVAGH